MTRRSLISGIAILAAWAITLGYIARNYYFNQAPVPDFQTESLFGSVTPIDRWEDIEEYMLIVQAGSGSADRAIVGASATHITLLDDPTTTATYKANLLLEGKLSPLLPTATVKVSGLLDRNVNLTTFHGEAALGAAKFAATGLAVDKILYLSTSKTNSVNRTARALPGDISMAEALRPALGRNMKIETGEKMSAPILDPLTGQSRGILTIAIGEKETLTLQGQQIEAFKVTSSVGDIKTIMWVNEDGQTIRRQLVGGLSMERTTREKALEQAPSIGQPVEIPEIDPGDFEGIAATRESDSPGGTSSGGLGLLESFIN